MSSRKEEEKKDGVVSVNSIWAGQRYLRRGDHVAQGRPEKGDSLSGGGAQ